MNWEPINNFLNVLALPMGPLSPLLFVICLLAWKFRKRVSLWVFGSMFGLGVVGWLAWFTIFVFYYPPDVDGGRLLIGGFAFTDATRQVLRQRPEIANQEFREQAATLLALAAGSYSQVWVGWTIWASKLVGLVLAVVAGTGLVGAMTASRGSAGPSGPPLQ